MPQLLDHGSDENILSLSESHLQSHTTKENIWNRALNRLGVSSWLKKDGEGTTSEDADEEDEEAPCQKVMSQDRQGPPRRPVRDVIPGLPRPITFQRQNSERRERLMEHEPDEEEKRQTRAMSVDRRTSPIRRRLSPMPLPVPASSAPDVRNSYTANGFGSYREGGEEQSNRQQGADREETVDRSQPRDVPRLTTDFPREPDNYSDVVDMDVLHREMEAKWILNLSMHFRDGSDREKFFLTYAEAPNKWRRVTVSCDYRNYEPDTLEGDLKSLHYQRDKSARIYEAIRDSLPDIKFFPTVTNLKLKTDDGRLHVHVTEDVNEIIPYPSTSLLSHLQCETFKESFIDFDSHLSGFVYKVKSSGRTYIKKEIPGPEAVEEFLYEANALSNLQGSQSVINFEGLVVDDTGESIKGLLISFAKQGALVDLVYDFKGTSAMSWYRRERWAKQIVQGLSEIHEMGYVQGDFTLSNIVIDAKDNAKIIDINRRGCPVGWEPPELSTLIESGSRISIYIGVKSDLFQLGMVLWGLAMEEDEPERQERPLNFTPRDDSIPEYYRKMVDSCLSPDPRERRSTRDLLSMFPPIDEAASRAMLNPRNSLATHRPDTEYIDPATAVGLEDIASCKTQIATTAQSDFSMVDPTRSSEYRFGSSDSYIVGRSPLPRTRNYDYSPYARPVSEISLELSDLDGEGTLLPPPTRSREWDGIREERNPHLMPSPAICDQNPIDFTEPMEQDSPHRPADPRDLEFFNPSIHNDNNGPFPPYPPQIDVDIRSDVFVTEAPFDANQPGQSQLHGGNSYDGFQQDDAKENQDPAAPIPAWKEFGHLPHKDSGFDEINTPVSAKPAENIRSDTAPQPSSSSVLDGPDTQHQHQSFQN